MIRKIRRSVVAKNALIYTLFSIINKAIPFLLLPILTSYLSQKDYGYISLFNSYTQLIAIFVGMNVNSAVSTNFFHLDEQSFKKYLGNVFYIIGFSTVIVIFIVLFFQKYIQNSFNIPLTWLILGIFVALMMIVTELHLAIWRLRQQSKPFVVYSLLLTLTNISISLLLIIVYELQWEGRLYGILFSFGLFGSVSFFLLVKTGNAIFSFCKAYIKDAIRLGISLMPHYLALWGRTSLELMIISSLLSVENTGLYAVGYQFGAIFGILVGAINTAYAPYQMQQLKNLSDENRYVLVKHTYLYFLIIFPSAFVFAGIMKVIFPLMVDIKFQSAEHIIIPITLAYAFQGMYYMVVNYIFFAKKNYLVSISTTTALLVQILLLFLFIKSQGIFGVALAACFSFLFNFILIWYLGNRITPMPWNLRKRTYIEKN